MILPDFLLHPWALRNVAPYSPALINPNSLNLRLSNRIRLPKPNPVPLSIWPIKPTPEEMSKYWTEVFEYKNFVLQPGQLCLLDTLETVHFSRWFSALMRIRSSPARIGGNTLDAGWVDAGFGCPTPATLTLEVVNHSPYPIVLTPGWPFVNLIVHFGLPARHHYGERQTSQYIGQRTPTPAGGNR